MSNLQDRELQNILNSGEIITAFLGGIQSGNQVLDRTTIEAISANVQTNLNHFFPGQDKLVLTGALPTIDLNSTGQEAALNIIAGGVVVGQIIYSQGTQPGEEEILITLKDQNGLLTELTLDSDGSVRNPSAPAIPATPDTLVTLGMIQVPLAEKATKEYVNNSITNTYTGIDLPATTLGKSGDRYHRYATKSTQVIRQAQSHEKYSAHGFYMHLDTLDGLSEIFVAPSENKIYFQWGKDGLPALDNPFLDINGTSVPLSIIFQNARGFDCSYDPSYDVTIQSVAIGTGYVFKADIMSGKDEDYTKFDQTWFFTPVMNETYDWVTKGINDTGNPIVISQNTFVDVAKLHVPQRDAGVYQITFTSTFKYNTPSRSAIFQWSLDNGTTWKTIQREPKDATNDEIISYTFPKHLQTGPIDFIMQAKCEGSSDTLTINFAHITLERKK